FLAEELASLPQGAAVVALGTVAHNAVLRALNLRARDYVFKHGERYALDCGLMLYDSYHCSRYNTQTRRLTEAMFHEVFGAISEYLSSLETAKIRS
ncbi:MAG TPA: uracil-DNA glycosylase, partial [Gallionellaceae bacterium]|nr:uracil-DNA glycosylase [Gallionellaceae bacterium]